MGLRDKFIKRQPQPVVLPEVLEPVDPVNYDSVLDWMIGLSEADYKVMCEVITIYRDANDKAAAAHGIKNQPTTKLKMPKLTNKQIEDGLDSLLETHPADLKAAIAAEKPKTTKKKVQSPSKEKKVTI
jgi:hypothetical protein